MTAIATSYESLLKVRKGAVDIVDVPEFGFVAVTGTGEPGGAEFTEAVQALYSVSYGAHFRLKKLTGQAPRVMPLEGLWWVDDPAQQDIVAAVARGEVGSAAMRARHVMSREPDWAFCERFRRRQPRLLHRAESAVWSISRMALPALELARWWHSVTGPRGLPWISV